MSAGDINFGRTLASFRRSYAGKKKVKSAESSPMVTRRPLCIPPHAVPSKGLLSCSGGQGSDIVTPRMEQDGRNQTEKLSVPTAEEPFSGSLPCTPMLTRKSGHLSRRQRLWRNLKLRTRLVFRSRSRDGLQRAPRSSIEKQDADEEYLRTISQSQPNLTDGRGAPNHAVHTGKPPKHSTKSGGARGVLKSIMRRGSDDVVSVTGTSPPQHSDNQQQQLRVGFSGNEQVISVTPLATTPVPTPSGTNYSLPSTSFHSRRSTDESGSIAEALLAKIRCQRDVIALHDDATNIPL